MRRDLAAPRYEPAQAYHPPAPAPFEFGVDTVSLEELLSAPATREILAKNAPWGLQMAESEAFGPFRSTFTLRDAATFVPFDLSTSIAAVDAALRNLPQSEWPASVR
jgi:hypothetical protein